MLQYLLIGDKMYEFFKEQLDSKIENHNLRTLREYCPLDAVRVKRDNKEYLMMASNNYLGLTFDTRVIEGAQMKHQRSTKQLLLWLLIWKWTIL